MIIILFMSILLIFIGLLTIEALSILTDVCVIKYIVLVVIFNAIETCNLHTLV